MAGSSASLNDKAWLEIKPGTLVIKPIRESALVLPSRDGPLQCGQAMISAVLIDGQEIHLQAMGSEVAYSPARGSSGILIHFCHDPDESDKDAQEYCRVVLASNQVVLERSATTGAVRKRSSHGCPAVFRGSQQVPQRRTDALFSRLSSIALRRGLARFRPVNRCTPAQRSFQPLPRHKQVDNRVFEQYALTSRPWASSSPSVSSRASRTSVPGSSSRWRSNGGIR